MLLGKRTGKKHLQESTTYNPQASFQTVPVFNTDKLYVGFYHGVCATELNKLVILALRRLRQVGALQNTTEVTKDTKFL